MTAKAQHIFYVYHPELDDKSNFSSHCGNYGEQTIVLGCYNHAKGIFIYDVKDERLRGVTQVTAAHEMLHAAYDRLSSDDKQNVDNLINQTYANLQDQRIRTNIENYRKQGADVTNELHSILATEVSDLPAPLEKYYQRYFSNRKQIVNYSNAYEDTFTSLKAQADQISNQLVSLKSTIDTLKAQLEQEQQALNAQRPTINTQAEADAYNANVRSYNNQVDQLSALIKRFNDLVAQQNQLALLYKQLYSAVDSRPTAVPLQ